MIRTSFFLIYFLPMLFADPVLHVTESHFDFGERKSGEVVEHEFLIENRGNETLKIRDIRTSCGCTTSGTKVMSIAPGQSRGLKVNMDLKGRSGPQTQHVSLNSNDPEQKTFSLKITGEAIPQIRVEPRSLNLSQGGADELPEGEITLTSTTGETFQVTSVKGNRDRVTAAVEMSEDGKEAKIRVTPRPQKGDGRFTDVLLIETSNPEVGEVKVLVMWQISSGVSVTPAQVNLVMPDRDITVERFLMVRGYPGMEEPLTVTKVEWPGQDVRIGIKDLDKLGWRIHLNEFTPRETMQGSSIVIHTNAKGFETMKVPVRFLNSK